MYVARQIVHTENDYHPFVLKVFDRVKTLFPMMNKHISLDTLLWRQVAPFLVCVGGGGGLYELCLHTGICKGKFYKISLVYRIAILSVMTLASTLYANTWFLATIEVTNVRRI